MPEQVKKKLAVFFNTTELGGAERSMLQQLLKMKNYFHIHCLVPYNPDKGLGHSLKAEKFEVSTFEMPLLFYQFSRQSGLLSLCKMGLSLFSLILRSHHRHGFKDFDVCYANGNKSAVYLLVLMYFKNIKKPLIWHWRDFPPASKHRFIFKKVVKFLSRRREVQFVANSQAVALKLGQMFPEIKTTTIYNFASNDIIARERKIISEIGVVSMLAPWKGLHPLILFFHLYEEKLKVIGISKVKIYGAQIYSTSGGHTGYSSQVKKLLERFPTSILSFEGLQSPKKIFQEIDLLIHYSLLPEPFGRVIAEAFWAKVPVISTATGGASELIAGDNGIKVYPHDFEGLFLAISKFANSEQLLQSSVENAFQFIKQFEKENDKHLDCFLSGIA